MVARMRSIETRRELIRAVNTGVSGHIAATGETVMQTETFEEASPVVDVPKLRGETVYVRIGRAFEWALLALFVTLIAFAWRRPPRDLRESGDDGVPRGA